jgi:hypothetical protein
MHRRPCIRSGPETLSHRHPKEPPCCAGDPQSWNLYSYVLNDPLVNIDPTGTKCTGTEATGNSQSVSDVGSAPAAAENNPPPSCSKPVTTILHQNGSVSYQETVEVSGSEPSTDLALLQTDNDAGVSGSQVPANTGNAPSNPTQPGKQSKSACNAQRAANAIPGATLTGNNTFQGGHEEYGVQVSGADLAGAGFSFYSSPFGNGNGYRTPFSGAHVNGQPGNIGISNAYGETFAGQVHFDVGNASSGFGGFAEHSFVDVLLGTLLGWIPGLHNFLDPGC